MIRACLLSVLFFSLCMLPPLAQAQEQPVYASDTAFFTSSRKRVNIPFKFVHNLVIIQVRINGSQPLSLILDSGVKNTIITRLFHSDSLDLVNADKITIRGLGEGNSIEAFHSVGNEMFLPGIKGVNHELYVLTEDVFNLSLRMGMPVHGIIGYDIFKNFIVKINYSNRMITLYPPDTKVAKKKRAEEFPLYIEGTKAYVYGDVRQHNGDTIKVKLVVDTGASNSLSLYLPTNDRLSIPPKAMKAYLGRGLSGDIHGQIGRLDGFSLGKYEMEDLTASYPDEESIKLALNLADRNGNLGSDILSRFTAIFDYPHNRLLLSPNRRFREPFQCNMSGFEVTTPLPGTNFYIVSNVIDDSPAKLVGLEPGDQLLDVNGRKCTEIVLTELLELLESKPGRKLRLRLKRESEILDVDLVLQSRI
ncbi:aspartyl protease family protein [Pontibacter sp. E15-1]|uniref:aspartyl protease family protein n=1 Tax=Pontibacter sp. E15-1 TaxID=2919918 RepID=UPI001F4FE393|nr:aspartyl protease family protein [Pontibacter sp. E15-1]MCJ8163644.1 aspartyl protease family protein [Pontibacter sp. E15-1]